MTDQNFDRQPDSRKTDAQKDETMDPRDLVSRGGFSKDPREIVENPAVTPEMLDEPQESRAGNIREDRGEDKPPQK